MDALLLLGIVVVVAVGIQHILTMQRLATQGAVLKQMHLEKTGRIISWVGFFVAIGGPRLFDVRYQYDNRSTLIASALYGIGFTIMFVGFKFRIAAFKTKEDTPYWIHKVYELVG